MDAKRMGRWILGGAALVVGLACRATPEAVAPAGRHALVSERLRLTMNELDRQMNARMVQEILAEPDYARRITHVEGFALELSESAAHIPDVLAERPLEREDEARFRGLVEELQGEARKMHERASWWNEAQIERSLDRIRSTCTECHGTFRDVAGTAS